MQITEALRTVSPPIALRMGIHSGPVYVVPDVNGQEDVAGDCTVKHNVTLRLHSLASLSNPRFGNLNPPSRAVAQSRERYEGHGVLNVYRMQAHLEEHLRRNRFLTVSSVVIAPLLIRCCAAQGARTRPARASPGPGGGGAETEWAAAGQAHRNRS